MLPPQAPVEAKLEQVRLSFQRQQAQLDALWQRHAEAAERNQALYECLQASGAVRAEAFAARLHRARFTRVLHQHPCLFPATLETVVQMREMTLALAQFCGPCGTLNLSVMSRVLNRGVREVLPGIKYFFSPAIYVLGGEGSDEDVTSTVERLNPLVGVWEPVALLPCPRAYCAATALGGKVYVAGGSDADGVMLSSMDRFDPLVSVWESMPPMRAARVAVAAAAVETRLLVVGGSDDHGVHDSVESFDPEERAWSSDPRGVWRMPGGPRWAAAAAAIGRHLYVVGGRDANDEVLSAVERLEPEDGRWSVLPPLRTPRASLAAAAVGGKLYVVGGYDATLQDLRSLERFDPDTSSWQQLRPMATPRFAMSAIACSGSLYVLGGAKGDVDRVVLGTVERFDPKTAAWSAVSPLRTPRRRFGVAACC